MAASAPTDPLIAALHDAVAQIAARIVRQPAWVRDVSAADCALIERLFELAILVDGGRPDVVH